MVRWCRLFIGLSWSLVPCRIRMDYYCQYDDDPKVPRSVNGTAREGTPSPLNKCKVLRRHVDVTLQRLKEVKDEMDVAFLLVDHIRLTGWYRLRHELILLALLALPSSTT